MELHICKLLHGIAYAEAVANHFSDPVQYETDHQ